MMPPKKLLPRVLVRGSDLVDEHGNRVRLRGCNIGNWLLIEPWMFGIETLQCQAQFVKLLQERFPSKADELLTVHRQSWFTERDAKIVVSFGFNVIRVPFHYSILTDTEDKPFVLRNDAFRWLDRAVDLATDAGLYLIFDMHGVPGGQSIDGPTGSLQHNDLWTDRVAQQKTVWLWQVIADRYGNNRNVVGYDLINEPYGNFGIDVRPKLLQIVTKIHDAIRKIDDETLILLPGTIHGISFYDPRKFKNVGLTEHFYPGVYEDAVSSLGSHARFFASVLQARRRFATVPFFIGEMNPIFEQVGGPNMMRAHYDAYGDWHVAMWSYKLLNKHEGIEPSNWSMVSNTQSFELNPRSDSFTEIRRKLASSEMELSIDEELRDAMLSYDPDNSLLMEMDSGPFFAPPMDRIPKGWTLTNIGGSQPGSAVLKANDWITLMGGGKNIFHHEDDFCFLHRPVTARCEFTATLHRFDAFHQHAKAGLMIRHGTDKSASHAFIHSFPDGRVMMAYRAVEGGATRERVLTVGGFPIRLTIRFDDGEVVAELKEHDGFKTKHRFPDLELKQRKAQIGLAVLAHDWEYLVSADFEIDQYSKPKKSSNLLANGSFEAGEGDRAESWNHFGEWINRETEWTPTRKTGPGVLGYHHWQVKHNNPSGVVQRVSNLAPGASYRFEVYCRVDPGDDDKSGPKSIELRIEWMYGDRPLTLEAATFSTEYLARDRFSRLQLNFCPPSDSVRVLLIVSPSKSSQRTGALTLDDASVRAVDGHRASASWLPKGYVEPLPIDL